ncbi:MAG: CHAT domain-containing protein [Cyanothece sp. SIO1E1]|nr:CHAT domain-containing protein [Cyanothece sp. SIO1E1]
MKLQRYGWLFLTSLLLVAAMNLLGFWVGKQAWDWAGTLSSAVYAQAPFSPPVDFIGAGDPQAQRLGGNPAWGTTTAESIFRGGIWQFLADDTFIFTPSPTANVRQDIFPISGTYLVSGNQLILQGERKSAELSATASVDGTLQVQGATAQLDIIYAVTAMASQSVVQITQTLTESSQAPAPESVMIEGISVPSVFAVNMQGQVDAQPFGPLSGNLKILPLPYEGDPNPFFVSLSTEAQDQLGSLFWTSKAQPAPAVANNDEFYSTITVENRQVHLALNPSDAIRTEISWFTADVGTLGQMLQTPIGVNQASQGTMTFSVNGNQVQGTLTVVGTNWFGQESHYQAEFSGQTTIEPARKFLEQLSREQFPEKGLTPKLNSRFLRNDFGGGFTSSHPKPKSSSGVETTNPLPPGIMMQKQVQNAETARATFEGIWEIEVFGEITLTQQGQEVTGTYTGQGGGELSGTVQSNRLDFAWQDARGSGWGFFRALANGQTLVGQWGTGSDPGVGESMTAQRLSSGTLASLETMSLTDLKYQAYDLVLAGRCQEAVQLLDRALAGYRSERDNSGVAELVRDGYLIDEVNILTRLNYCHLQLGNYEELIDRLNEAIKTREVLTQQDYLSDSAQDGLAQLTDWLDTWRVRLASDTERIQALDQSREFFDQLTRVLVELGDVEGALVASEKGRARAIADLLSARLLNSSSERTTIAPAPTLEEIRRTAQDQQSPLIEYAINRRQNGLEDALYIWVISPSGEIDFKSTSLAENGLSLDKIIEIVEAIGSRGRGFDLDIDTETDLAQLRRLHELLIDPIIDLLPADPNQRVTFIPQRELLQVPFPALIDADNAYLIEKRTITTAPSIQVLDQTRKQHQALGSQTLDVANNWLLVGNPTMPSIWNPKTNQTEPLPTLRYAEAEARIIADLFSVQPLIGAAATEAHIKQTIVDADIIHLATHGLLEYGNPQDSGVRDIPGAIALAPGDGEDGLLTSAEIRELQLKANLVVLSACDTGLGNITGDGVIGLSRALITAGSPSLLVSLWSVPDEATSVLMQEFYQKWQSGLDKAQALRKAMLITKEKHPDPSSWAAFTLIGEAQ